MFFLSNGNDVIATYIVRNPPILVLLFSYDNDDKKKQKYTKSLVLDPLTPRPLRGSSRLLERLSLGNSADSTADTTLIYVVLLARPNDIGGSLAAAEATLLPRSCPLTSMGK